MFGGLILTLSCGLSFFAPGRATAQPVLHPNDLVGPLTFSGCGLPAGGPVDLFVQAPNNSVASYHAEARAPGSGTLVSQTAGFASYAGGYTLTVPGDPDCALPGLVYDVNATVKLISGAEYTFAPRPSGDVLDGTPVASGGCGAAPIMLGFCECPALVEVCFVDCNNAPYPLPSPGLIEGFVQGQRQAAFTIPAGSTCARLLVRGGVAGYQLKTTATIGTDDFFDRRIMVFEQTFATLCGGTQSFNYQVGDCGPPGGCGLGRIVGNIDMLGENELASTRVVAEAGPWGNFRWHLVPGAPSQGAFDLQNLVPSSMVTPDREYSVYGEMSFRTGHRYEWFQTPRSGNGVNGLVLVPCGGQNTPANRLDLANRFVLDPGYVQGAVHLCGPQDAPALGLPSYLRWIERQAAATMQWDSAVKALGEYVVAAGATRTAYAGLARCSFAGSFGPASDPDAFVGDYDLVLGGLDQESSVWSANRLQLLFANLNPPPNEPFLNEFIEIEDQGFPAATIVPGQILRNDHDYCFSEVILKVSTTAGQLHSPSVSGVSTTDGKACGNVAAVYRTDLRWAYGTPGQGAPAPAGQIALALPAGTYTLHPGALVISGGSQSGVTFPDIQNYTIGCGMRAVITPEIQVVLTNWPDCVASSNAVISGRVQSADDVVSITYRIGNGPAVPVANAGGLNPSFTAQVAPLAPCANAVTVEATDLNGHVSSVTVVLNFDTTPPVLSGCQDLNVPCDGTNPVNVSYVVTATDNCPGPVSVICAPPPGLFPLGTTPVTCTAEDRCHNVTNCAFNVTVSCVTTNDCCSDPAQNLVVNGSFEQTTPTMPPNDRHWFGPPSDPAGVVPGWTTVPVNGSAEIEIWRNTFQGIPASDGLNHLEINAERNDQTVRQTVNGLRPGCPATLCFDYTGRFGVVEGTYNNDFDLILSGGYTLNIPLNPPIYSVGGWQRYSITLIPWGSSITIAFHGQPHGSGSGGAHIDRVCLTQPPAPPALICAPDKGVPCGAAWDFDPPTAVSCGCSNLVVTVLGTVTNGACQKEIKRTWLVTDSCGLSNSCSQTVTVADVLPPELSCPDLIKVATCSNSARVFFNVTATDRCEGRVAVQCVPPSGSAFNLGTTWVQCTAADVCGNSNSCAFRVVVTDTPFWQLFPAGWPDCYFAPNEPARRGACLISANPGVRWKNFDDPTVDRFFGQTWPLPAATYTDGWLITRLKDDRCKGISTNDTINLGLLGCAASSPWAWGRQLGPHGSDPGLQPAVWCNIPGCLLQFALHLSALPAASGPPVNVLPLVNSDRRLDMVVQDDTRVDFAWLWLRRCPPRHLVGGWGATLTNAELAHGRGEWTLVRQAGTHTGFSATLDFGAVEAARLDFAPFTFGGTSNASLRILEALDDRLTATLAANPDGTVSLLFGDPLPGATQVEARTLSNGVVVASNTLPAAAGTELARFPASASIRQITVGQDGAFSLNLGVGGSTLDSQVRFVGSPVVNQSITAVTLHADGFDQITLGSPAVRVLDCCDPVDGQHDDWSFAAVTGGAVGRVENGQLTLSALDAAGAEPMGFDLSLGRDATNQFRATIPASFGQFASAPTNASLELTLRALGATNTQFTTRFARNGSEWDIVEGRDGFAIQMARVEVWQHGVLVAGVSNPASVAVSQCPLVYWPGLTGPGATNLRQRFLYSGAVTVRLDGASHTGDELRVLTATDTRLDGFTSMRVETVGAEALLLSAFDTGARRFRFEPPALEGGDLLLRADGLGGVIEAAPTVRGPWTPVPLDDAELRVAITNAPAQFFRMRVP